MKIILITLTCLISSSSYGGDVDLHTLLGNFSSMPESVKLVEVQTPKSVVSDSGYQADHEPLIRNISDISISDSSTSSVVESPVATRPIVPGEMFLDSNGNLIISFPEGVWINFSKIIICQNQTMMGYKREITGSALIYPETSVLNDES